MSVIDDFMSKVIDFDEKEKEETILFLANALLCNPDHSFLKFTSKKVSKLLVRFADDAVKEKLMSMNSRCKNFLKGGEKIGTSTRYEDNQRRRT